MTSHILGATDHFSRFRFLLLLLAIAVLPIGKMAAADEEEAPYCGEWSNTHDDMLLITSDSIQLNAEKPVHYDDITEDSDGSFFVLQITSPGELSYFSGKFLRITFGKDPNRFTMAIYKTLADALHKQNETSTTEWSAKDDEEE